MKKTVVLGMSGGVDSSVCAVLLKDMGYNVIGLFMKNWDELDKNGKCMASLEYEDVVSVCKKLDIPHFSINFEKEYKEKVFDEFVSDFQKGLTPNPDVLCNREIKFKVFYEKALELGADFVATGHYCQTDELGNLLKGKDLGKDQTYFLYAVKSDVLKKVLFPIGNLEKKEVRRIASEYDLKTKDKKDSTGICFIGERNFKNFLGNYLEFVKGDFQDLSGNIVGEHTGAAFYTLGQRKGLGLGGQGEPWFVVGKDIQKNIVYVERGLRHPAMFSDTLEAEELAWVSPLDLTLPFKCKAKVRYRQPDQDCIIEKLENGKIQVFFPVPQRSVTPGQAVVFYLGDRCLGGGKITSVGPSYYSQGKEIPISVSL
ncbi:MAG: tRNA 2-thiouridine(34) synthase MnmA [Bacteriovoracales bacterium]